MIQRICARMNKQATLYYVHDPMCSWCWAYRPILAQVERGLQNHGVSIVKLLGGLAPDTDQPMPIERQQQLQGIWRTIEEQTGTQFNHAFWKACSPRRATWPACRAVIAASLQNAEQAMIYAIQAAYYLRAMNPSEEDTLLQLADELGLDFDRFAADLASDKVANTLEENIQLARQMPVRGFPSWVLDYQGEYHSIALDYHSHVTTLASLGDAMKTANRV